MPHEMRGLYTFSINCALYSPSRREINASSSPSQARAVIFVAFLSPLDEGCFRTVYRDPEQSAGRYRRPRVADGDAERSRRVSLARKLLLCISLRREDSLRWNIIARSSRGKSFFETLKKEVQSDLGIRGIKLGAIENIVVLSYEILDNYFNALSSDSCEA